MKNRYIVIFLLLLMAACSYKKESILPACIVDANVSFTSKVNPVIINNCLSCHNNGFLSGGISLEGYNNIKQIALNGKLLGSISHSNGFSQMPKGKPKLDDCTIANIKKWVDNGALNN